MLKNTFENIEKSQNVEDIKYRNEKIWPLFRLKITEGIRSNIGIKSRLVNKNLNLVIKLFTTVFYGFENIFIIRRFDVWAFSSSDRRKIINQKYVDRVLGGVVENFTNTLIIENPFPLNKHYNRRKTDSKYIISLTLLWGITKVVSLFLVIRKNISNENLLQSIISDNELEIDYKGVLKEYLAQYWFFTFVLTFIKPKVVFFVYSASSMGYIKALKKKNIPVIEIQHGVINKSHFGYNIFKDFGKSFFPDYLFTYGETEVNVFDENNYFIKKDNVFPVGYYYLDKMLEKPKNLKVLNSLKSEFDKVVTYSFQEPFEKYIFDFLLELASSDTSICYLLVPRDLSRDYSEYNLPFNIKIMNELNVYECIKISNFHSTINSTCAIESLCLGVPNILFNFRDLSQEYYSGVLDVRYTKYVSTPEEFLNVIRYHSFADFDEIIDNSKFYMISGYTEKLLKTIRSIDLKL